MFGSPLTRFSFEHHSRHRVAAEIVHPPIISRRVTPFLANDRIILENFIFFLRRVSRRFTGVMPNGCLVKDERKVTKIIKRLTERKRIMKKYDFSSHSVINFSFVCSKN